MMTKAESLQEKGTSRAGPALKPVEKKSTFTVLTSFIKCLLFNPKMNLLLMPALLVLEYVALTLITERVPYTEIDYLAYMEQIDMIEKDGNFNYTAIEGGTGPLVYPAGHVLVYKIMYRVTNRMENLAGGQLVFKYLYLLTLFLQFLCYYHLKLPPYCVIFASLSKRLHSIYVLRLFNDCFATLFMVLTVLSLVVCAGSNSSRTRMILSFLASLTYSIAVSVKMNALLYFPAVLISVYLINDGLLYVSIISLLLMLSWQIGVAIPFLRRYPKEYLKGAFNFGRQFMFKWSVNWQFVGEDGFSSRAFQTSLLVSQVIMIVTVLFTLYPQIFGDIIKSLRHPRTRINTRTSQKKAGMIAKLLVLTNFIGVLFSRSLHYQFLSWYHWTLPILIYLSGIPWFLAPVWYILHEYCWNSYPPNARASTILFVVNALLLALSISSEAGRLARQGLITEIGGEYLGQKKKVE